MIATAAPDFAAALPDGGRLAGLDVGTRTIGVALCDAGWSFATPDKTILRRKFAADLEALRQLVTAQSVVGLVVGLPLNMDGSDSPRTQSTRAFARNLAPLALPRSEEHTSELQSLMRISYAVFCLKKKNNIHNTQHKPTHYI